MNWSHKKCERHIHMGGSISPETVWEIIVKKQLQGIANSLHDVRKRLIYQPGEDRSFAKFLSKFQILDEVSWDAWAIDLACYQICKDLAFQGTQSVDISFSVEKYVRSGLWSHSGAIRFICDSYAKHSKIFGIDVGPILSIAYHAPRANQVIAANLIDDPEIAERVIGLDLVGDECHYDSDFYGPIIERWNLKHKITREHLAELPGTADNLRKVLTRRPIQRPKRIAHGIQGKWDDLRRASDNGIYFDLALYSNLATGAVSQIDHHQLPKLLKAGCLVTLNTDDPIQFGVTLDDEFELALRAGLVTHLEARDIQKNAVVSLR